MTESFTNPIKTKEKQFIQSEKTREEDKKAKEIWENFLLLLSHSLKESEIRTWFSVLHPKSYINNVLTITVPSKDYYGMIEKRYNKQIVSIIGSGLLGENGKLNYEIEQKSLFEQNEPEPSPEKNETNNSGIININSPYSPKTKVYDSFYGNIMVKDPEDNEFNSNLMPRYNFENLVKGESNDFALNTAYAITNNLGKIYNPYFLFGGVGLGKTHIIQAIGNEIRKKNPEKKVYYTSAPDFTTHFTTSIARDETKQLDAFYKSLDVLILDDIQNLEGKPGTQDFVYQIFNTLYNNKKHLIFSSDKPISQVKNIEERLISRFQWGITADIQMPSWEMRVAIIQKKLEEGKIELSEDIIHYVATNVKDSIRTIEGCIASMISESLFRYKGEITLEIAENVINRVVGTVKKAKNISIENIIYTVSEYFNLSENQILSRKRTKEIAFARQIAMYLAKELTSFTLESIGLNFGGKDHATVLYSANAIKESMKKDKNIMNIIHDIKEKINNL